MQVIGYVCIGFWLAVGLTIITYFLATDEEHTDDSDDGDNEVQSDNNYCSSDCFGCELYGSCGCLRDCWQRA